MTESQRPAFHACADNMIGACQAATLHTSGSLLRKMTHFPTPRYPPFPDHFGSGLYDLRLCCTPLYQTSPQPPPVRPARVLSPAFAVSIDVSGTPDAHHKPSAVACSQPNHRLGSMNVLFCARLGTVACTPAFGAFLASFWRIMSLGSNRSPGFCYSFNCASDGLRRDPRMEQNKRMGKSANLAMRLCRC